mmetsp:Transcript_7159/g.24397  ORF Transcript_7159/g.24397 Transcript_7159/m.24397 type:complete len:403 (-) Transcript_7159:464-1672(-)
MHRRKRAAASQVILGAARGPDAPRLRGAPARGGGVGRARVRELLLVRGAQLREDKVGQGGLGAHARVLDAGPAAPRVQNDRREALHLPVGHLVGHAVHARKGEGADGRQLRGQLAERSLEARRVPAPRRVDEEQDVHVGVQHHGLEADPRDLHHAPRLAARRVVRPRRGGAPRGLARAIDHLAHERLDGPGLEGPGADPLARGRHLHRHHRRERDPVAHVGRHLAVRAHVHRRAGRAPSEACGGSGKGRVRLHGEGPWGALRIVEQEHLHGGLAPEQGGGGALPVPRHHGQPVRVRKGPDRLRLGGHAGIWDVARARAGEVWALGGMVVLGGGEGKHRALPRGRGGDHHRRRRGAQGLRGPGRRSQRAPDVSQPVGADGRGRGGEDGAVAAAAVGRQQQKHA